MKKKDLIGKSIRVIIWGRNEYDGHVQCHANSFNSFDESSDFYFKNGMIHYHLRKRPTGWCAFKKMKHHYVFETDGVCKSHQPKRWLNKRGWNLRKGLPYAELVIE